MSGGSAEFTRSAFKWKDGQVWLAKCSEVLPIRWSRPIPDGCEPSTITVKMDVRGRWYVSLLVDNPTIKPLPTLALSKPPGLLAPPNVPVHSPRVISRTHRQILSGRCATGLLCSVTTDTKIASQNRVAPFRTKAGV